MVRRDRAHTITTKEFLAGGGGCGPICYHLARNDLTRHKFSFHPIRQLADCCARTVTHAKLCVRD